MTMNLGSIDRLIRLILGGLLIAFALRFGFPNTGWNWVGWIGGVPIVTAVFGTCPLYSFLHCSTR